MNIVDVKNFASNILIPKSPPSNDFPSDVLKYMKKNATPKQVFKLMKLNKYFIPNKCPFNYIGDKIGFHKIGLCVISPKYRGYKFEEIPNNLVIIGEFRLIDETQLTPLISKTLFFDINCLVIHAQKISFDDFKFLTSSKNLKKIVFKKAIIASKNGEIVPYESIPELVPSLHTLELVSLSTTFSQTFVDKICASNLKKLSLTNLNEIFDFEAFLLSMKKKPNLYIQLYFAGSYSLLNKINSYVDKFIAAGLPNSCPPDFLCGGTAPMNYSKLKNLRKLYIRKIRESQK